MNTNKTLAQLAAAGTASGAAASSEKEKVQPTTPDDIARLPLLVPFQIQNPSTSNVVTTLMNEQTTADTLAALIKKEEKLRSELQKAKGGDDDKDGKRGGKAKKGKKASSSANATKIKELEQQIDTMQLTLHQIRQNLTQYCNWTVGMLQGEYSKLAVTLDPDSERCEYSWHLCGLLVYRLCCAAASPNPIHLSLH